MEFLGSFIECYCKRSVDMNPNKESYPVTFNKEEILNRKSNPITLVFKLIEILAKYKI